MNNQTNRRDFLLASALAAPAIMGREAIYQNRIVTWNELGVEV